MVVKIILKIKNNNYESDILSMNNALEWIKIKLKENDIDKSIDDIKKCKIIKNNNNSKLELQLDNIECNIKKIIKCNICLETPYDDPDKQWVKMKCCDEKMHINCKENMLKSICTKCIYCGDPLDNYDNNKPYGTMIVENVYNGSKIPFKGKNVSYIRIHYNLKGSNKYYSDIRSAIVPNTKEGNELVDKLIHCFKLGYTFTIGRSLTRKLNNVIIWAGIHHKTSHSGTFGYPDDDYIDRVTNELGCLNIFGPYKGELNSGNHKVIDYR